MKKPAVLIVEDDGLVALGLMELLQKSGYDIPDPVITGENAVEYVKTSSPDLILMNIKLAGKISGVEAARRIRDFSYVPIIFITAHTRIDRVVLEKEIPRSGFIVKPFMDEDILSAIEMALKQ